LLDFVAANICVYFQYFFMHFVCANILGAIVLKPRFKIDVVVVVIRSIVMYQIRRPLGLAFAISFVGWENCCRSIFS
jgi:hypothetical protein